MAEVGGIEPQSVTHPAGSNRVCSPERQPPFVLAVLPLLAVFKRSACAAIALYAWLCACVRFVYVGSYCAVATPYDAYVNPFYVYRSALIQVKIVFN